MRDFAAEEKRSHDEREADQLKSLNGQLGPDNQLTSLSGLRDLPVLRKSDLTQAQSENPPFGRVPVKNVGRVFQSPGPIYEPGGKGEDWWRLGRFLNAVGVCPDDLVQNTFSYHFTPAGAMFESAADAVGATVFPAGPGQTTDQARSAAKLG
ncbi:MAG: phenylacetate--CoA ligase family protein, partial [Pseudomonadota bacterium]